MDISYYDVECMYPIKIIDSTFEIALDMLYNPNLAINLKLLGFIWVKGEIERQYRKIWKEFKQQLEVF